MDYFIGRFGKDDSFVLASNCRFVVDDRQKFQFLSFETLEECAKYYDEDGRYTVYSWGDGFWRELNFLSLKDRPSKNIGFHQEKPN